MVQGEAKVFETDVVIFSVNPDEIKDEEKSEKERTEVENEKLKIDIKRRFARLKKIKKYSSSIL